MANKHKRVRISFDYIHAVIDDHSLLDYAEDLPDEKGAMAADFLLRDAVFYWQNGIPNIEGVISDNIFGDR